MRINGRQKHRDNTMSSVKHENCSGNIRSFFQIGRIHCQLLAKFNVYSCLVEHKLKHPTLTQDGLV